MTTVHEMKRAGRIGRQSQRRSQGASTASSQLHDWTRIVRGLHELERVGEWEVR